MYLPKKAVLAAVAIIAIAVPAVVIAASGENGALTQFQYFSYSNGKGAEKAVTNTAKWKDVPGLGSNYGMRDASIATVSAELKRGSAKFRVVDENGLVLTQPASATFVAGAGSFAFPVVKNASCFVSPKVQWRRVGKRKAVLGGSTLTVHVATGCP
jgi:hypothetical protein